MYSNDDEIASEENRFRSKPGPSCQKRKHVFPGRSRTVSRAKSRLFISWFERDQRGNRTTPSRYIAHVRKTLEPRPEQPPEAGPVARD